MCFLFVDAAITVEVELVEVIPYLLKTVCSLLDVIIVRLLLLASKPFEVLECQWLWQRELTCNLW